MKTDKACVLNIIHFMDQEEAKAIRSTGMGGVPGRHSTRGCFVNGYEQPTPKAHTPSSKPARTTSPKSARTASSKMARTISPAPSKHVSPSKFSPTPRLSQHRHLSRILLWRRFGQRSSRLTTMKSAIYEWLDVFPMTSASMRRSSCSRILFYSRFIPCAL
ncbi:hypothetical protein DD238_005297 [Peronospora effusa]|uniref:Uncharacterized protein n=1 Tax=Peronospora effusa TaxID=542832 RepID=A0A3M6VR88_9STRA|nr:hypothetical protein DD238_005297 [Peronospora effusa]